MTPCTTAAAVRREAIEPTMDILGRGTEAKRMLLDLVRAVREVNALINAIEDDARRSLGLLDTAQAELDAAEREQGTPSEAPNARLIATGAINPAVDTLNDPSRGTEHDAARGALHTLFQAHGETIFERRYTSHVGAKRGLTLRTEYDVWLSQTKRRAAA